MTFFSFFPQKGLSVFVGRDSVACGRVLFMLGFLYILKNPSQIYWSHELAANHPPGKDPFQT